MDYGHRLQIQQIWALWIGKPDNLRAFILGNPAIVEENGNLNEQGYLRKGVAMQCLKRNISHASDQRVLEPDTSRFDSLTMDCCFSTRHKSMWASAEVAMLQGDSAFRYYCAPAKLLGREGHGVRELGPTASNENVWQVPVADCRSELCPLWNTYTCQPSFTMSCPSDAGVESRIKNLLPLAGKINSNTQYHWNPNIVDQCPLWSSLCE